MASYHYTHIDSHELQIRVLHILPKSHTSLQCKSSSSPLDSLPDQGFPDRLEDESSVSCTLHVVSLKDKPEYHALSYCWGDSNLPRGNIRLDETEIEVTISLEQALKAFRHETVPIVFWIDAICINQNDPEEKAEQIKLMRDIYSCATIVDVFLGPGTPETDKAMEAAQRIGYAAYDTGVMSITRKSMENCQLYIREDHEGYGFNRPKTDDPLADVKLSLYKLATDVGFDFPRAGWSEIGKREYWKRLWVMQEFCLGKELLITCGKKTLPFDRCFEAAWVFLTMQSSMVLGTHNFVNSWNDPVVGPTLVEIFKSVNSTPSAASDLLGARKQHWNSAGSNLQALLQRCCLKSSKELVSKAKYPRDLIYGLLGMASDAQLLNIQPVYTNVESDDETVQIFTNVTRNLLKHGNIDILAWCQQPKSLPNLPSWVPDFSSITSEPSCETKQAGLFSASGKSSFSIASGGTHIPSRRIRVKGTRVDTVMEHGILFVADKTEGIVSRSTEQFLEINANQTRYFDEIKSFCEQARKMGPLGKTLTLRDHPRWFEAFWRIPCADQVDKQTFRTRATHASLDGYNEIRKSVHLYSKMASNLVTLHLSPEELEANGAQYRRSSQTAAYASYRTAMSYQTNRRPFISTQGYVGLVPGHALPGDVIIIIFGAVQPYVVRSVGKDKWELIGEAYVHGIMDGEFMETDFQTEEFVLC